MNRATVLDRIERGEKAIDDLCTGRLRWEMRVPAEPDHDPDLILSDALRASREVVAGHEAAVEELERIAAGAIDLRRVSALLSRLRKAVPA